MSSTRHASLLLLAWRWVIFAILFSELAGYGTGTGQGLLALLGIVFALCTGLRLGLTGRARGIACGVLDLAVASYAAVRVHESVIWLLFTLAPLDLVEMDLYVALAALVPGLVLYPSMQADFTNLHRADNVLNLGILLLVGVLVRTLHLLFRQEKLAQALVAVIDACQPDRRPSMEDILAAVLREVQAILEASTVGMFWTGENGTSARVARSMGDQAAAFHDFDPAVTESVVTPVLKERQLVQLSDYRSHPTSQMPPPQPGFRTGLIAPLLLDSKTLGALWVSSSSAWHPLGGADVEQLRRLASQVTVAVRGVQLQEASERVAVTDRLTGLLTGSHFQTLVAQSLVKAKYGNRPLTLLTLDIDNFKRLNSEHGHPQADSALQQVGTIVHGLVRNRDLVSRPQADLFMLTLIDTPRVGALVVAERIRQQIEETEFVLGNHILRLTVSAGVATYPDDGSTGGELLDVSNRVRLQAKQQGGNRVCFSPPLS